MPVQPFLDDVFPGQDSAAASITVNDPLDLYPEQNLSVPWTVNPQTSWLDYRCWVEVVLDAGMALHKPLPQTYPSVDTLGTIDAFAPDLDLATGSVNMKSSSQATDIIQRMATSEYRFVLHGWGLRIGYQIPIPSLLKVGNAVCVPEGKQRAMNVLAGCMAGIPLWYAAWELPYVITTPLGSQAKYPVPPNPALHVRGDAELPLAIILPRAPKDDRAVSILRTEKHVVGPQGLLP